MSLKPFPIIINSDLYQKTWKDTLYNNMNSYLYSIGKYKTLTDKGKLLGNIGKDNSLIYEELYFYKSLISYFINARETLTKSDIADFALSKKDYKFTCIRDTIFCKYVSTKIFDDLYEMSGLSKDSLTGLDFMIFDPSSIGDELVLDADFIQEPIWILGDGWEILYHSIDFEDVPYAAQHSGSSGELQQEFSATLGNVYIISINVVSYSGSSAIIYILDNSQYIDISEAGNYIVYMKLTNNTTNLINVVVDGSIIIDNISIKEINSGTNNLNDFIIQ